MAGRPGVAPLKIAAAMLAATVLGAGPGLAQGMPAMTSEGPVLKMTLSGFEVQLPMPSWAMSGETPALDSLRTQVSTPRPGFTFVTFHRADENAILWTELMGVQAVGQPGYTAGLQFRNMAQSIGARCRSEALELFWIVPLPGSDREALAGLCGEYALDTRRAQSCNGGIFTAVAVERPEGMVSAYHEWCTESFNVREDARWPLTRDEIEAQARRLQVFTDFRPVEAEPAGR